MAKAGRKVKFHGAFKTKADARAKEKKVKGSWIRKKRFKKLGIRYMVLTAK